MDEPMEPTYGSLVRRYVSPPSYVERPWLIQAVEEALADPACRFVLLVAPPGAGKTAFAAGLAAAEAIQDERWKASALSGVAQAMAQAGDRAGAMEAANRALAVAEAILDEYSKSSALSGVAQAMVKAGQHTKALQVLRNAFRTSRLAGRNSLFEVLEGGAYGLAAIDKGQTLRKI